MTPPADIQPAIDSALERIAIEIEAARRELERLSSLLQIIASAATVTK